MAKVSISIGGYQYELACRNGEEAHLVRLGKIVEAKANEARAAVGTISEVRQLLLAALLLADERETAQPAPPPTPDDRQALLLALADRVEAIAQRLEKQGGAA